MRALACVGDRQVPESRRHGVLSDQYADRKSGEQLPMFGDEQEIGVRLHLLPSFHPRVHSANFAAIHRLSGGVTVFQRGQSATFDFTPFQAVVYPHRCLLNRAPTDPKSSPMSSRPTAENFTPKQGQYLAFIYAYARVLGRPPAEADMQRHFGVSPPSVHQMVLTLERAGLVRRQPGVARSIEVLVAPELLPVLR
jgi:hypothetical protein